MSKLSRRDFLKLGSLAALSAPVVNVIGKIGDHEIVESKEEFGDFAIRRHSKEDPPYDIDFSKYKRMSGLEGSFTRNPDKIVLRNLVTKQNQAKDKPGDDWLAYAYAAGQSSFMFASENYAWDGLASNATLFPEGRWIPEKHGYTIEEVTKIIKRSAKLFGASLVGIAPVNEMWFYSETNDMDPSKLVKSIAENPPPGMPEMPKPGEAPSIDPEQMAEMLPRILEQMSADDLKEMMVGIMEKIDPELLPMPIAVLKAMPAKQIKAKIPDLMKNANPALQAEIRKYMDPSMIPPAIMVEVMGVKELMKDFDFAAILGGPIEIKFTDEVDKPMDTPEGKFIPKSMKYAIVMAFEMDETGIETGGTNHLVSVLGDGATMSGYSRMNTTSWKMANMLRRLGWNAIPMGNDHALSIPMAVDAGLGEQGRNGVLVTPKYGPRVRLAKVLTDLPLITDEPISFGVTEFCEICGKCAKQCPSGAIPAGERTYEAPDSGIPGLYHWPCEGDKCFAYWAEVGGSCYNCIRVCPFNKPESWLHDATRVLIGAKSGSIDNILLKLDDASGYGTEKGDDPRNFWDKDAYIHIKNKG